MSPSELRVNNLVRFVKEDKISEIGHHNLGLLLSNPASNDFEPIPLTEEWLLKFGFEKEREGNVEVFWPVNTKIREVFYGQLHPDFIIRVIEREDKSFGYFIDLDIVNKSIESVHQLQNIYFALTGEELNIKL